MSKQVTLDGDVLATTPRSPKERAGKKRWWTKHGNNYRDRRRCDAILKVARAWNESAPKCWICGCPHIEALTFGHPNENGKEHREHIRDSTKGHRRTPHRSNGYKANSGRGFVSYLLKCIPEEIKAWNVRLECVYCNHYQAKNGKYPSKDKLPIWEAV